MTAVSELSNYVDVESLNSVGQFWNAAEQIGCSDVGKLISRLIDRENGNAENPITDGDLLDIINAFFACSVLEQQQILNEFVPDNDLRLTVLMWFAKPQEYLMSGSRKWKVGG